MRASRRKHYIMFQTQVETKNSHGARVKSYVDDFDARCNFRILSGVEMVKSNVDLDKEYASIRMQNNENITLNHFVLYKDNLFDIISIKPMERDREVIVTVSRQISGNR